LLCVLSGMVYASTAVPSHSIMNEQHTAIYEFFRNFAGPLATVIATGVAAWITFRFSSKQAEIAQSQADVALDKLKFDLFERRINTYDAIREVIGEIVRHGVVTNQSTHAFLRAIDKVEFLFGPEIKIYLDGLYKALLHHHAIGATLESLPDPQRNKAIDAQCRRFEEISNFYVDFPKLLAPYVRMRR
jgi:hypothetical protein